MWVEGTDQSEFITAEVHVQTIIPAKFKRFAVQILDLQNWGIIFDMRR